MLTNYCIIVEPERTKSYYVYLKFISFHAV